MEEIEVKILNIDRKKCEQILSKLGAKKIFEGELITLALDTANNDLKKNNKILRIRKKGNDYILGVKELISKKKFKRMNEIEINVSNFDNTIKILETLNFKIISKTSKKRVSYKLDNLIFDFDKYTHNYSIIPEFLEIECSDIKLIAQYAKILGYKKEDMLPWGFKELLKYYKNTK
ncbi:MAG: class IV adenylate cyclase [Candidatus Woesearchaeota archaeon]